MAALKAVIGHRVGNQKAKYVAYLAFLVLTTMLVVYSVMLLLQDISILANSDEQTLPSYMSTSSSVAPSFSNPTDIEIIYPSNDQTANTDSNLEISGISNYDPSSICHVSVIINDVKPYKKTIPMAGNMNIFHGSM